MTFFSHFVRYNQGHRHGERRGKRTQEEEVTERVGKGLDIAIPEQEGKIGFPLSPIYLHPCGLHWRFVNLHPPHATWKRNLTAGGLIFQEGGIDFRLEIYRFFVCRMGKYAGGGTSKTFLPVEEVSRTPVDVRKNVKLGKLILPSLMA